MKIALVQILLLVILIGCGETKQEAPKKEAPFKLEKNMKTPEFNTDKAYKYIKTQVDLGPRNPNSEGHQKMKEIFREFLGKNCDKLVEQNINYPGYNNEKLKLTNFIARYNPEKKNRIFFAAHWDSRPRADKDKDESRKEEPILGANDGGSGTGILMHLAEILKEHPVDYGVDLIFFDGEDYGTEGDLTKYCLGSKYLAAVKIDNFNPEFGILLDLVGDKEAQFKQEEMSVRYAPEIVNMVWAIAKQLNATAFVTGSGVPMYDDHYPLNQAGIKTINIIDSELVGADSPNERRNYWHTHKDNMDNIGKETLNQVGEVMVYLIYSLKFN